MPGVAARPRAVSVSTSWLGWPLLEVFGEEGHDGFDGLADIRLVVVQIDVQLGVQPDHSFGLTYPLVGLARALGGTVGVLDSMDDQSRGWGQEIGACHVVYGDQFAHRGTGDRVLPIRRGAPAGAVVGERLLTRHGCLTLGGYG